MESFLEEKTDQYEALSYVWGDMKARVPIKVGSAMLQIGLNLRHALLAIRLPDASRTIWADALCINQEDLDERKNQVAIMRKLYRNASQTLVWLGNRIGQTKGAFADVQRLFDEAQDWRINPHKRVEPRTGATFKELLLRTHIDTVFAKNPWWRRIWTAQEILLAKRASLWSGQYRIDWDTFLGAIAHGAALGLLGDFPMLGVVSQSRSFEIDDTLALRSTRAFPTPADEMLFLLINTRHRLATDPRDKIFAILGLVRGDMSTLGIQADYRATTGDVFRHTTMTLLVNSGNLNALGLIFPDDNSAVHELPSWVPNFGSVGAGPTPMMEDSKHNLRSTHASKHLITRLHWEDGGTTLVIDGHSEGTITHLGRARLLEMETNTYMTTDDDNSSWLDDLLNVKEQLDDFLGFFADIIALSVIYLEWEELAANLKPTNPGLGAGDSMLIFCLTLCAGTLAPEGLIQTYEMFKTWVSKLEPLRRLRERKVDEGTRTYRILSLVGYIRSTWSDYGEFISYLTHTYGRKIGATSMGYLCLLPKKAEVGDKLVILKGGRVPVVLRPRDDGSMQFIGEAYVDGIMDGEAFREEDCAKMRIR